MLNLVEESNNVLKQVSAPVELPFREIEMSSFVGQMFEAMYKEKGIGLAAVQIGYPVRIVVCDVKGLKYTFLNPIVVSHSQDYSRLPEGCLSLPGRIVQRVPRFNKVEITALDEQGKRFGLVATGLLGRCLQHELDHLDGVLVTERVKKGLRGDLVQAVVPNPHIF